MRLPEASIRRPVTVLVATAALLVLGAVSLTRLPLDFLPNMDAPFIGVWAPYPNSAPSQTEELVARPIEEVLATLGDVKELFSNSDRDGAFVGVEFEFGRPVDVLRMEVKEKLEQVRPLLPADLRDTFIFTFNTSDIPILVCRISAQGRDLSGSYDLIDRRILNPLRRIDGVGRVQVDGITQPEVVLYLSLDRILEHQVDVEELFRRLDANNLDLSVGRVRDGQQQVTVRALGQFRTLEEIEEMAVGTAGLRLSDVAEVVMGEPAPSYRRRLNGEPAIAFDIQKASGANTVDVSRRVHRALEEIRRDPALEGVEVVTLFDQGRQVQKSLKDLLLAGVIGSLLSVAILFVFLRRIRPTLIVSAAIPLSVIATCVFLFLTGRSLNLLTMAGLMLAVGMLVDNAIVVLEAVYRKQERGLSARSAARRGSQEVAMAVTAATLTSVIVFAPLVLSKGNEVTVWLREVGITISVTLIFSLLSCLTLVPLLAARVGGAAAPEMRLLSRLREGYVRALAWTAVRHPKRTGLLLVPLAVVLTVAAMQITGFKPEPEAEEGFDQDALRFGLEFVDNSNIHAVERYIDTVESWVIPRLDSLRVESIYTFYTDNRAEFSLFFPKGQAPGGAEIREMRQALRDSMPQLAGAKYRFGQGDDAGAGAKRISVTLFGEDTERLEELSQEVRRRLALLPGMEDVKTDAEDGDEEVRVVLDRAVAGRYGIDPRIVSEVLGLTFRGFDLREYQGSDREVPMSIVLEPTDRRNIENLRALPVTFRDGKMIRLDQVARFEIERGPGSIRRSQQKTAVSVAGSYEGEEYGPTTERVREILDSFNLPAGYSWSFGRRMAESQQQQDRMGIDILLALCCIYFVLASLFESFLHPLVIMLCVPLAILGVIWTLLLTGTPMNVMAMIGLVILIGVVVNNGIVLVAQINTLRRTGLGREEAILEAGRDRFRPILMTAATTILGLVPLAAGGASVGQAQYYPLARTLIGGLAAGTLLSLIVLPTFYVLAEGAVAHLRAAVRWGLGRGPLPWRDAPEPVESSVRIG